jgi:hypothetical protein
VHEKKPPVQPFLKLAVHRSSNLACTRQARKHR